jgi:hypothetical protein
MILLLLSKKFRLPHYNTIVSDVVILLLCSHSLAAIIHSSYYCLRVWQEEKEEEEVGRTFLHSLNKEFQFSLVLLDE